MREKVSRRTFLQLTGGAGLSVTLAGCFGVGNNSPNTGSSSSTITIWDIRTGSEQQVVQNVASAFNSAHSDIHVVVDFFQNDPYKQKLQVAMGAHNPPDIFFGGVGIEIGRHIVHITCIDIGFEDTAAPAKEDIGRIMRPHRDLQLLLIGVILEEAEDRADRGLLGVEIVGSGLDGLLFAAGTDIPDGDGSATAARGLAAAAYAEATACERCRECGSACYLKKCAP